MHDLVLSFGLGQNESKTFFGLATDQQDLALVLSEQKPKQKLVVLTGENSIAKRKKVSALVLPKTKTKHKIVQVSLAIVLRPVKRKKIVLFLF